MVNSGALALDPVIWRRDSLHFDSYRFLAVGEDLDSKTKKLSMRHFGGGVNYCPGRHFAGNEILGAWQFCYTN